MSSRIKKTYRNSIYAILSQFGVLLFAFITRTFFIRTLGVEYLGLNGLFSNILNVLSLAELGFGTAMTYNLYKPLSQKDDVLISKYLKFYSKTYLIIGLVVLMLGAALIPFLPIFIRETISIERIETIYVLFLVNSSISYLWAARKTLIIADQKNYVLSLIRLITSAVKCIAQIIVLVMFKDFILFLVIQIAVTLLENIYIFFLAKIKYKSVFANKDNQLSSEQKKKIYLDVRHLFVFRFGSVVLESTDNIIISAFIGLYWVGLLSNYTLILTTLALFLGQLTNAYTASTGNVIATENLEVQERTLDNIFFVNFLIYAFSFSAIFLLVNPFISLWLGSPYKLNIYIVFFLSLNMFIAGSLNPIWTYRTGMGLFRYGRYRPIISAIINLGVSILLANYIGLLGVIIGTTVTRLSTNVWYDPLIVYKYGLLKSPRKYYFKWFYSLFQILVFTFSLHMLFTFFDFGEYVNFAFIIVLFSICFGIYFGLLYRKKSEFKYLLKSIYKFFEK